LHALLAAELCVDAAELRITRALLFREPYRATRLGPTATHEQQRQKHLCAAEAAQKPNFSAETHCKHSAGNI
jgi:hypothetical protein